MSTAAPRRAIRLVERLEGADRGQFACFSEGPLLANSVEKILAVSTTDQNRSRRSPQITLRIPNSSESSCHERFSLIFGPQN